MSNDRARGRRAKSRAFRPELEGQRLEARVVMSRVPFVVAQYLLTHPQPGNALKVNQPRHYSQNAIRPVGPVFNHGVVETQTARGGQSVIVAQPDGSRFRVSLSLADNQTDGGLSSETGAVTTTDVVPSNVVQPQGTVRAYAMPGGQVGIIVDGSTSQQQAHHRPPPVRPAQELRP